MFWLSQMMHKLGSTGSGKSGMQPAKLTHLVDSDSHSNGCFNMLLLASLSLQLTTRSAIAAKLRCSMCKLWRKWRPRPIIMARILRPMNDLQLCHWQFSQRHFAANFLQAKCDFTWKLAVLRFWVPLGGLGTTYDVHLRLTGKRIVDFLLVLI